MREGRETMTGVYWTNWTFYNKTTYLRLHLSDEVSTERPETSLRLP